MSVCEHWDFLILFAPLGKEAISDFRNRRASLPRVFWLIKMHQRSCPNKNTFEERADGAEMGKACGCLISQEWGRGCVGLG